MTSNLLLIIVGFGLLIFVHELGHFAAAKWAGIRTEAFAIGMGHVVVSWRKGVGFAVGSTHRKVVAAAGKAPAELSDEELARHGIGETEYSLRWLPIGGFVKMLGQDDLDPAAVSRHPRSFNACPVSRRMVVVSGGVIMNLILAAALFIVAFMVGVRFEAAIVGDVASTMPAGEVAPLNGEALGVTVVGLQPGDRVLEVNGKPTKTFADLQIAAAMSRPDEALTLSVERDGLDEPLRFKLMPEKDPRTGLLGIGVAPGSSNALQAKDPGGLIAELLAETGLDAAGVTLGMELVEADGRAITTYEQLQRIMEQSDGRAIATRWSGPETGVAVEATLEVEPVFQLLRYPELSDDGVRDFELGLYGLVPLVKVARVPEKSRNADVLQAGDVILRVNSQHGPRDRQVREMLQEIDDGAVEVEILRDGRPMTVRPTVRQGMLNVYLTAATELPIIAAPMTEILAPDPEASGVAKTVRAPAPAAALDLLPRTRLDAVDGIAIEDWNGFRRALRDRTAGARDAGTGVTVELTVMMPRREREQVTLPWTLDAAEITSLHALGWTAGLPSAAFEPVYTLRTAEGNPARAIVMGVEETHKLIVMTYLTIDRLFRGTVGVEQLRGPVGIVHIGTKIADRGFTYLIFFLAMISVNLAVINFLPLPIVDGGLFLYLIYEKLKGRPPSVAFQNAATIVGLFLIGTVFLVVTWNDVVRLLG
ncbi:MAG: site-2 protease family protein [Planctomycetota bacterium]|jgi:regulator of sigma E protease